MDYIHQLIGRRIREERKKLKLTQAKIREILSDKYGCSVGNNTYIAIEKGEIDYCDLTIMTSLCKIFNCDMGYLLCEYDERTQQISDISNIIGLSETAITKLINDPHTAGFINYFLENPLSYRLIMSLYQFCRNVDIKVDDSNDDFVFKPVQEVSDNSALIEGYRAQALQEFNDLTKNLYSPHNTQNDYKKLLDKVNERKSRK